MVYLPPGITWQNLILRARRGVLQEMQNLIEIKINIMIRHALYMYDIVMTCNIVALYR